MTDPRRVAETDQREAGAADLARIVAAFYRALRAAKVPAHAAQGITETYLEGLMAVDDERPW